MTSALFKPIKTDVDLADRVKMYDTTEGLYLDFKAQLPRKEDDGQKAVALDIAAFANTWGGTLLIGIREQNANGKRVPGDVIHCNFESDREWVEQAIRDRIVPADVGVECVPLTMQGKTVMAVNVAPDDRLIAEWDRKSEIHYPIRNNHGNAYMSPNEVVERATVSTRAGQIKLLRAIEALGKNLEHVKDDKYRVVDCAAQIASSVVGAPNGGVMSHMRVAALLTDVDAHQFLLQFSWGNAKNEKLWLPYGVIREAWPMDSWVGLILHMGLARSTEGWTLIS